MGVFEPEHLKSASKDFAFSASDTGLGLGFNIWIPGFLLKHNLLLYNTKLLSAILIGAPDNIVFLKKPTRFPSLERTLLLVFPQIVLRFQDLSGVAASRQSDAFSTPKQAVGGAAETPLPGFERSSRAIHPAGSPEIASLFSARQRQIPRQDDEQGKAESAHEVGFPRLGKARRTRQ